MLVCKQTPRKNVQLVNRPSENTASVSNSTLIETNTTLFRWKPMFHIAQDQTKTFSMLIINI